MILWIPIVALLGSVFLPWYYVAVFAAVLASAKTFRFKELGKIIAVMFVLHLTVAIVLDRMSGGIVSERISNLLGLPFYGILYIVAATLPCLLFFSTIWVIMSGRKLVRRPPPSKYQKQKPSRAALRAVR